MAKITLIGLHNYTEGSIWDGFIAPTGFDKNIFINTVLLNYGEFETLYAQPEMMALAIKNWCDTNTWGIIKAVTAINISYDPLHNYDRTETRTKTGTESGTNTGTVSNQASLNETMNRETESNVESSTSSTTNRDESTESEHKVSAYDSSTYSPDSKDTGTTGIDETVTGTGESSGTGTEEQTTTGTESSTRTDNLAHANQTSESEQIRAYGNIGVTTSQQMLLSELSLSEYNLYQTFAGIFAFDLLIMVY